MAGTPNSFRYSNTGYRRQQVEISDYLSRNLVGKKSMPEENYHVEYVFKILAEQADSNLKY